jgi:pimeloyl-ACP methyl ester carboxylesterase
MSTAAGNAKIIEVPGGRIAYEVSGEGPLVVLSHGMGDNRSVYRFLAPLLAAAGYQVAAVDLRGHGASSAGWASYTHADIAGDLLAVIAAEGGPAVIVGHSCSGGAVTVAAGTHPDQVSAVVEIGPATRPYAMSVAALLRNRRYRRGFLLLGRGAFLGSVGAWGRYLDHAYPGVKPADWDAWLAAVLAGLRRDGRMRAVRAIGTSPATGTAAQLPNVRCPALIIMGTLDPDWPDPQAEAAAIVGLLPAGTGRYVMIEGAGHYPHAQYPAQTAEAILAFLSEGAGNEAGEPGRA